MAERFVGRARIGELGGERGGGGRVDILRRHQPFQCRRHAGQVVRQRGCGAEHPAQPVQQSGVVAQHGEQLHAGGQAVDELVEPGPDGGGIRLSLDGGDQRRQQVRQQRAGAFGAQRARAAGEPGFPGGRLGVRGGCGRRRRWCVAEIGRGAGFFQQAGEDRVHLVEVAEQAAGEGGRRGVAQEGGERGKGLRRGGQAVGLAVLHHLQAVFGAAQRLVGSGQGGHRVGRQMAGAAQSGERGLGGGRAQGRVAAAPDELEHLRAELDLAYAALPELQVVAQQALLRRAVRPQGRALVGVHTALHRAYVRDRGEIQVAAPDERPYRLEEASAERQVAGHRARLYHRRALPGLRRTLVIGECREQRDGRRRGAGIGAQAQVDAEHVAAGVALGHQGHEVACEPGEDGAERVGVIGMRFRVEDKDEVHIAGKVEFPRAELAHREHAEAAAALRGGRVRQAQIAAVVRGAQQMRGGYPKRALREIGEGTGHLGERPAVFDIRGGGGEGHAALCGAEQGGGLRAGERGGDVGEQAEGEVAGGVRVRGVGFLLGEPGKIGGGHRGEADALQGRKKVVLFREKGPKSFCSDACTQTQAESASARTGRKSVGARCKRRSKSFLVLFLEKGLLAFFLPPRVKLLLHFLGEVLLSLLALAALAACLLVWRLTQGPMDVTWLLRREPALLSAPGLALRVGHAAIALPDGARALAVTAQDLAADRQDGSLRVRLRQAGVQLALGELLIGRMAPRGIDIAGGDVAVRLLPQAPGGGRAPDIARLADGLQHVRLHDMRATLSGASPGVELVAPSIELDLARQGDGGVAGQAQVVLQAGAANATLDLRAEMRDGGAHITGTTTPLSPAALAGVSPRLAGLSAIDAPVRLAFEATLGPGLQPRTGRLEVAAGAGTLHAGRGSVKLASLAAVMTLQPAELRLESLRAALAPSGPAHGPAPVLTATASATRDGAAPAGGPAATGHMHASFAVQLDALPLADLAQYLPEGVGGGARPWLVENLPAGRAHDAQVSGALDAAGDLSNLHLTALTGGMAADDVTVFWLRPVPGLTHGHARVVLQDADTMVVSMDRGGENNLVLAPGSSIKMTGLSQKDQFGDIEVGLSGPLSDALALLNHPRLHLLDRGGFQVVGARGQATAHIGLHVPLDARVTMEQIAIDSSATLSGVHLGRIAAGRDLDDGAIKLHVTGDGLSATGTGAVGGIPAALGMEMDFRDGKPDQVQQHVTASGRATAAQMLGAGAPAQAARLLTDGAAGLHVEYTARRNGTAALQIDSDLTRAALVTPFGWSKKIGEAAALGGRATLDHGRLTGVDDLHAEGPGLAIVSRTQVDGAHRTLVLDRLEVGRTQAQGRIGFPEAPGGPVQVEMSGPVLDLAAQLEASPATARPPAKPAAPDATADKPGQAWAVKLAFDQVDLAHGKTLAPFTLDAANDGRRMLHAHARAGAQGEIAVDITPQPGGRSLAVSAADAGAALRALGVADNLAGGKLSLTGAWDDTKQGAPLGGTATLTEFNLRTAAAIGRLLQAMTLYGLTDVLRGPGLHFSKLVAPFALHDQMLHLTAARAFSSSLGITAQGDIDLRARTADITGTVVPAYFFNQLLGDLPLIGRIFSPEKGGGVFAARYSVRGKLDDPKVGVNPLSALTPGFLREGFGLFSPRKAGK